MRRRRRPVLGLLLGAVALLAAVLALAAAGAVAAALLIDPNGFKPAIVAALDRATGGTLDLGGPIRIGFGLPPSLIADDITFRSADGGARLALARLSARIALLPLLTGELDIVRLDLLRPDLDLTPAAAAPRLAGPATARPATAAPAAGRRLHFAVEAVHVAEGRVAWRGAGIAIPRLDAVAAAPGASVVLSGEIVSGDRRLALSGETGPPERLLGGGGSGGAPFPVQLVLQGPTARLALRGTVAQPMRGAGYALQADAAATDLSAFAPLLPVPVPRLHDLSLSARLVDAGQGGPEISALVLHVAGLDLGAWLPGALLDRADLSAPDLRQPAQVDLAGSLGAVRLHLRGAVGPLTAAPLPVALAAEALPLLQFQAQLLLGRTPRPAVRGSIAVQRLDLDALLAALPGGRNAAGPPAAPAEARHPAHVIPDRPFDLAALRTGDADLQLSVATLRAGGADFTDATGHLLLAGGRLALDPVAATAAGGRVDGRLAVDAAASPPPMALALHAPSLALAPLAAALGAAGAADGTASVDADLHAAGASPHALAAALTGHATLTIGDADVDNALLGGLLGGVLRAARLPENALGGAGRTRLRCLDLRLTAQDGTVTVARLLADLPRLQIEGAGTADLGAETLGLHLRPMLRVGPGVVVPVRVGGSFAEPKLALDTGAAGRTALLGALAGLLAGGAAPPAAPDPCAVAPAPQH